MATKVDSKEVITLIAIVAAGVIVGSVVLAHLENMTAGTKVGEFLFPEPKTETE